MAIVTYASQKNAGMKGTVVKPKEIAGVPAPNPLYVLNDPEAVRRVDDGIDGQIDAPGVHERFPDREEKTFLDLDELAETYWHLVEQDNVSTQPFEIRITNGPQNSELI